MAGAIYRHSFITRIQVQLCPNTIFVFGDNMVRRGYGGQAMHMRGEPNAIGVPTKWAPGMKSGSFFCDDDFVAVRPAIDEAFNKIRQRLKVGHDIVIPTAGLGTGFAELPLRAPQIYRYIEQQIASLA